MAAFDEMRGSLMWFIFLGLWSSWRNHKHKLPLQIYSFYLVLSECGSFYYILKSYDIFSEQSLISIIAEWLYIFASLTHLIISIESLVKSNVQVQLIQKLSSVDEIFKTKMNLIIPYRKEKREIRFRNIILASTIILMKIIVTALFVRRGKVQMFWYPSLFSTLISFVRSIQIQLFVYLLRNRLKLVNKEVIEVRNALFAKANNDYAKQTIYFARHTAFNRILILKMIYAELYEMCRLIRKTFGWSLLAVVTQYFLDFTFNCYWVFLFLMTEAASVENIVICYCLLAPTAALLGSMSFNCSLCYEYGRQVEVNILRFSLDDENEPQNDLIREFSMQVHHERVNISANGFFNLNLDFLGTMLAGSITCLVILIQFELSNKQLQDISNYTLIMDID